MGRFHYGNALSCFLSWDITFLLLECIVYFGVSCRMSPFLSGARSQPCNHGHRADRVTSESDTAAIAYGRCALNKASVVFSFRVLLAQRATEQRILGFMADKPSQTDGLRKGAENCWPLRRIQWVYGRDRKASSERSRKGLLLHRDIKRTLSEDDGAR